MAYVISDECIACGACAEECPVNAISEGDRQVRDRRGYLHFLRLLRRRLPGRRARRGVIIPSSRPLPEGEAGFFA